MKQAIIILLALFFAQNQGFSQVDSLVGEIFLVKPFRASIEFKTDSTYEIFAPDPCIINGQKDYHHGEWTFKEDTILLMPANPCISLSQLTEVSISEAQFESNNECEIELQLEGLELLEFGWPIILIGSEHLDTVHYYKKMPKIIFSKYSSIIVNSIFDQDIEVELPESIAGGDRIVIDLNFSGICVEEKLFGSTNLRIPLSSINSKECKTPFSLVQLER